MVEVFTAEAAGGDSIFGKTNDYLHGAIVMHTENTKLERVQRFWLFWLPLTIAVALFLALTVWARLSLARGAAPPAYASAEQASQALYEAVQNDNEQAILQILRDRKGLASSGDELEDNVERKQFAAKYQEMHRLVRQADGSIVLYIGAENWPFPVPLISEKGKWRFDADAGRQELFFRRIGENESVANDTCHALARAIMDNDRESTSDDFITQYAVNLVNAQAANARRTPLNPFYGYYFRKVSDDSEIADGAVVFVAYPAQYRSSGVMTFVITSDDVVFEKDLGPQTARLAKAIGKAMPVLSWQLAE
jgi:hypothetical protein